MADRFEAHEFTVEPQQWMRSTASRDSDEVFTRVRMTGSGRAYYASKRRIDGAGTARRIQPRLTLPLVVIGIEALQNEIRDAQTMRIGYRRSDFTLDRGEFLGNLLVGFARFLASTMTTSSRSADLEPLSPRTAAG